MADLIDRQEAIFQAEVAKPFTLALGTEYDLIEFLEDQPTVDAVPVVRCGKCKFCHDADGLLICRHSAVASRLVSENFFCAYGEK